MTAGTYEIATEHAILVEASAAGTLKAIPAVLLFGVLLGVIYDMFRIVSAVLGCREDHERCRGRMYELRLRLRQGHFSPMPGQKQELSDEAQRFADRKRRRIPARVLQCLLDLLYFLVCGILGAVFLYWRNFGILRWYLMLCGCIGFLAYRRSIGRMVLPIVQWILEVLCTAGCLIVHLVLGIPLRIGYRMLAKLGAGAARVIKKCIRHLPHKQKQRRAHGTLCEQDREDVPSDPDRSKEQKRSRKLWQRRKNSQRKKSAFSRKSRFSFSSDSVPSPSFSSGDRSPSIRMK